MNPEQIASTLKEVIKPYLPEDVNFESIDVNDNFTSDIGVNSMHLVDIALDMEDAFDIEIDNEELEQMSSIQDAIELIRSKVKGNEE